MNKWGGKHAELVKVLGFIGIGVGYIGLFSILFILLKNMLELFIHPKAVSAVSLVIPGVKIPGSTITIPLITGWIALFIVIVVHEFSHGVVAKAHKLNIKSSGIFFLGPLMGAFVEPEEKKLRKTADTTQYSVYAAGPFSNVILAVIALVLLSYVFVPVLGAMSDEVGVELVGVTEGFPALTAGLKEGMLITEINSQPVHNYQEFSEIMRRIEPGENLSIIADEKMFELTAASNPENPAAGFLGVLASSKARTVLKNNALYFAVINKIVSWLAELLAMIGILSFGIGLANLLPLGPVDGGRMLQVTLEKIKGEKKGNMLWRNISIATLVLLALNLFWPVFKWLGGFFI
jgi:membrane-associated protease RseP (regulator of RpoE activity)